MERDKNLSIRLSDDDINAIEEAIVLLTESTGFKATKTQTIMTGIKTLSDKLKAVKNGN